MMIPAGSPVLLDTNIPVYAAVEQSPFHHRARARLAEMERMGASFCISRQILREFLATMTRPGNFSIPLPLEFCLRAASQLASLRILEEDSECTGLLLDLLTNPGARGKQVHDANIAATMRRHGVSRILTHNGQDFERYRRWLTIVPLIP